MPDTGAVAAPKSRTPTKPASLAPSSARIRGVDEAFLPPHTVMDKADATAGDVSATMPSLLLVLK